MYYAYILKSDKTGKLYIGQTQDVDKRLQRHNSDLNSSTKGKGPWKIIYKKSFNTRSDSVLFELKLKKIKTALIF